MIRLDRSDAWTWRVAWLCQAEICDLGGHFSERGLAVKPSKVVVAEVY
jgi:hypothetical protein